MAINENTASEVCQACGKIITGRVCRFSNVPDSAFCSDQCQTSKTEPVLLSDQIVLLKSSDDRPRNPVYSGPLASRLHFDTWCDCAERYDNQICVPKRHSIICLCPRCGCVTQD